MGKRCFYEQDPVQGSWMGNAAKVFPFSYAFLSTKVGQTETLFHRATPSELGIYGHKISDPVNGAQWVSMHSGDCSGL